MEARLNEGIDFGCGLFDGDLGAGKKRFGFFRKYAVPRNESVEVESVRLAVFGSDDDVVPIQREQLCIHLRASCVAPSVPRGGGDGVNQGWF